MGFTWRIHEHSLHPDSSTRPYHNRFLTLVLIVCYRRKDLQLKEYKHDILLITGVLGSYASVVEKLHKDLDKNKATLLKIERAGDVLNEAVITLFLSTPC